MPYSKVGMMDALVYVKADSESRPHLTPDRFLRMLISLLIFFVTCCKCCLNVK